MCVGQPDRTHTYTDVVALNQATLEVRLEEKLGNTP